MSYLFCISEQQFFSPVASPGPNRHHFYDYPDATSLPQLHRHKIPQMEFKRAFNGSDVICAQVLFFPEESYRYSQPSAVDAIDGL